jgi:tetratricopeptide (TPR) repeat protein
MPVAAQNAPSADKLVDEAIQKRDNGNAAAAVPLFEQAITLYREALDQKGEAVALGELGNAYQVLGDQRQAIEYQRQALEVAERSSDRTLQIIALGSLASSLESMGKDDQAIGYYKKSIAISLDQANYTLAAKAQFAIGKLLVDRDRFAAALDPLKDSLEIARRAKDRILENLSLTYLGITYSYLGKRDESISYYREALTLTRSLGNRAGEMIILNHLAAEYYDLDDLDAAIDLSQQSLTIGSDIGERSEQIEAFRMLSRCYMQRSDFRPLIAVSLRLRALARENSDTVLEEAAVTSLALSHVSLGETEKAISFYGDLLILARKNNNLRTAGHALKALSGAASSQGDHVQAVKLCTELLKSARETSDAERESEALSCLGAEHVILGRGEEAKKEFDQALAAADRSQNKAAKAFVLVNQGQALLITHQDLIRGIQLLDQGLMMLDEAAKQEKNGFTLIYFGGPIDKSHEISTALLEISAKIPRFLRNQQQSIIHADIPQIIERSLARAQRLRNSKSETELLTVRSEIAEDAKDYTRAIETGIQALAAARETGAIAVESRALQAIQRSYFKKGDHASAIQYGRELLALSRRAKDHLIEAYASNMLAESFLLQGDLTNGISLAEQALTLSRKFQAEDLESTVVNLLANAYGAKRDSAAAIQWYEEALRLARRTQDRKIEAEALQKLGQAYHDHGDYVRAISTCGQSLRISQEPTAKALLCVGTSYDALLEPKEADRYLSDADKQAEQTGDPELMATIAFSFAEHYRLSGNSEEAAKWYRRASDRQAGLKFPFTNSTSELSIGLAEFATRRLREAILHFEKAFALVESSNRSEVVSAVRPWILIEPLGLLSYCYVTLGESEKGVAYAKQELEIAQRSSRPTLRVVALHTLGYALWRAGRLEEAREILQDAISEWDNSRGEPGTVDSWEEGAALDEHTEIYELLQQILVTEGRREDALEVAERGRARALTLALALKPDREKTAGVLHPLPKIDSLKQLAKRTNLTVIEYSVLYDPTGPLLPNRIRGKQPEREQSLFIWLIRPNGEIVFRKVDLQPLHDRSGGSLTEMVRVVRGSVGGRGRGQQLLGTDPNETLRRLYDLLIAPIAEHLPSDPEARVVFVPQGPLFLVPFPALQAPSGRYLIEDHTILSAPSIDALASIQRRTIHPDWKPGEVLVVGNPTIAAELKLAPYNLPNLPDSGKEATAIAANFGAKPFIANAAGKATILQLLPQRRLLHLATHGLLEGFGDPLIPGALVLAPDKNDDGLLTAKEVLGLDLHADLAVLSACDTGGGRITSDGVIGLSRAFLSAGVPNVMVSLWSIPDSPTSGLMQRFYSELKGNPDPGRALRLAMLATMKDHPRSGDWAGFTLIGGLP